MMTPVEAKKPAADPRHPAGSPADRSAPKEARKRRKSAVYDAEGNEVLITMMCLKCRAMKPLAMFGLRKMADGAIRNQPWCRTCRSGAGTKKEKKEEVELEADAPQTIETAAVTRAEPAVKEEPQDESKALLQQLIDGPPPA